MKSPFNGEVWIVPPEVTDAMYAELVKRGFEPIPDDKPKPEKARAQR